MSTAVRETKGFAVNQFEIRSGAHAVPPASIKLPNSTDASRDSVRTQNLGYGNAVRPTDCFADVAMCLITVFHVPNGPLSPKLQTDAVLIRYVLLGSLGLTRGPGNNVIPEGSSIYKIPYVVNFPVAAPYPQLDCQTRVPYDIFYHVVNPTDFVG